MTKEKKIFHKILLLILLVTKIICDDINDKDVITKQLNEQNVIYSLKQMYPGFLIIINSSPQRIHLKLENLIITTQIQLQPLQGPSPYTFTFDSLYLKDLTLNNRDSFIVTTNSEFTALTDFSIDFLSLFIQNITNIYSPLFRFIDGNQLLFQNGQLINNNLQFGFALFQNKKQITFAYQEVDQITINNLQKPFIVVQNTQTTEINDSSFGGFKSLRKDETIDKQENQLNEQNVSFLKCISSKQTVVNVRNVTANFENQNIRFLNDESNLTLYLNIQDSLFSNMKGFDSGGCISCKGQALANITNTIFDSCQSEMFGGALFVQTINASSSVIIQNSVAKFAGGSFASNPESRGGHREKNNITYLNNTSSISAPQKYEGASQQDFRSMSTKVFEFDTLYQLNYEFQNSDYYLLELQPKRNSSNIYEYTLDSGIFYLIRLRVEFGYPDGQSYYQRDFNKDQQLGNLYTFLIPENIPFYVPIDVQGVYFPYLVFYFSSQVYSTPTTPMDYLFSWMYTLQYFKTDYYSENKKRGVFHFSQSCSPGMQRVKNYQTSEYQCRYCGYGLNINQTSNLCVVCDPNYYSQCFANFQSLNENYWRKESATLNEVEYCHLNRQSCNGTNRTGFGNQLCSEGYIGEQCLTCDIKGEYWNGESYGGIGVFQCVKCNNLSNNTLFFYFSVMFTLFIFVFSILSSYKRMKSQILRDYLSKMNIIYIGTSFIRQNQASIYIKILLFNFQMYILTYDFVDFDKYDNSFHSTVYSYLNPLQNRASTSIDCFLNSYFPDTQSLGDIKIKLCLYLPIIFNSIVLVYLFFLSLYKKKQYYFVLIHSVIYSAIFIFQSSIIQYSVESMKCLQLTSDDQFLMIDLQKNCKDLNFLDELLPTLLLIVYVFSIPIALFFIIYISREKLDTMKMIRYYGFMYDEYKRKYYYWQFIKIGLSVTLSLIITVGKTSMIFSTLVYCGFLSVYSFLLSWFKPFQQKHLNAVENISIKISILYLISSVCLQIAYSNNDNYDASKFIHVIANLFYYSIFVYQILFYAYLVLLIFSSALQITLIKLQRFQFFQNLSIKFPNIFSKVYSNKLRLNYKFLRQQIKIHNPYYLIFSNQIEESSFNEINKKYIISE